MYLGIVRLANRQHWCLGRRHGQRAVVLGGSVLVHSPGRLGAATAVKAVEIKNGDEKWAYVTGEGDAIFDGFDAVISHSFHCSPLWARRVRESVVVGDPGDSVDQVDKRLHPGSAKQTAPDFEQQLTSSASTGASPSRNGARGLTAPSPLSPVYSLPAKSLPCSSVSTEGYTPPICPGIPSASYPSLG